MTCFLERTAKAVSLVVSVALLAAACGDGNADQRAVAQMAGTNTTSNPDGSPNGWTPDPNAPRCSAANTWK